MCEIQTLPRSVCSTIALCFSSSNGAATSDRLSRSVRQVRQANEADPFVLKIELIKEADGTWIPLMCITSDLSMQEIIASYGIRFGIEEVFKDLKETYWLGQTGCPKFMDVC